MRSPSRTARRLAVGLLALGVLGGCALIPAAVASAGSRPSAAPPTTKPAPPTTKPAPPTTTTSTTTTTTTMPVTLIPPQVAYATGNAELDALLPKLPPVLFEGGAVVNFGYNPLDTCCHAGGYNPGPNDVWVSERALASTARLTYVAVHELAHSMHIKTARAAQLTAAVSGAPVVRAGSAWDVSEKVADCVAWILYPAETAASGITYWSCPDPWRSQVRAALQ
jgi:hypothetical protein